LAAKAPTSTRLNKEADEILAASIVRTVEISNPVYIDTASGPHLTDVDQNQLIDLASGYGPHIYGNRPEPVYDALLQQLERGWHFGVHSPLQNELGRRLRDAAPCAEAVVFANSGTEATMYAIRAARAFTGKTKVAMFDGSYHGAHDYACVTVDFDSPRDRPTLMSKGAGIPSAVIDTVVALPYNSSAAFDLIREQAEELALVIVEPVQSSNPRTDIGPWLRELSAVCKEVGVLFALDEVITGFRLAYGGGQEYFDVKCDLATYGKALGGGLPIGAVAGRRDIMSVFGGSGGDTLLDGYEEEADQVIFYGGTFSGNPLTMAAGIAMLDTLSADPGVYGRLKAMGDLLAGLVNDYASANGVPVRIMNASSMFYVIFGDGQIDGVRDMPHLPEAEKTFYALLQERGVLIPGIHLAFVSDALSEDDIRQIATAMIATLEEMRATGELSTFSARLTVDGPPSSGSRDTSE